MKEIHVDATNEPVAIFHKGQHFANGFLKSVEIQGAESMPYDQRRLHRLGDIIITICVTERVSD